MNWCNDILDQRRIASLVNISQEGCKHIPPVAKVYLCVACYSSLPENYFFSGVHNDKTEILEKLYFLQRKLYQFARS